MFELERRCGRTAGEEENGIGIVHLVGRFDVESFEKDNRWNEDGIHKDGSLVLLRRSTSRVRRRMVHCLVMGMLGLHGSRSPVTRARAHQQQAGYAGAE